MGVDQFLDVTYKLSNSEKFDEFMKELGVGLVTRKFGNTVSASLTLSKDGDTYTLKTSSTFKNTSLSFKLGEEFDEETIDGRQVKSTVTEEGNSLVQVQKGNVDSKIVREFSEKQIIATMTVNDVTCTRTYDRVE